MWGHGKAGRLGSHRPVAESLGGHLAPISLGRQGALWGGPCGQLGGRDAGAGCVWDDSGPMITACAYLGSINRRGRRRRKKGRKERCGWGKRGAGGAERESPPSHAPSRHNQASRPMALVLPLCPPPKSGS